MKTGNLTEDRQTERPTWPYLILVFALLAAALAGRALLKRVTEPSENQPHVREFLIFNTYGRVTLWEPEKFASAATDEMIAELLALEKVINTYDADSEISELNRTAHERPFVCSDRLWGIIKASRSAYEVSEGAFDISVGPLMKLWGFYGKRQSMPSEEEITGARQLVGLNKVMFNSANKTVEFPNQGMYLDFGGIAKGYAVDICKAIADRYGLSRGMIDLGGNIACLSDPPPERNAYTLGIRNPANTQDILETVDLRGMTIATSGNYERCFLLDGRFIHHIVDPLTGWPVPAMASVSVIVPRGLASDVFSTAIFVRGEELALKLIEREPSARILTVSANPGSPEEMEIRRYNWKAE